MTTCQFCANPATYPSIRLCDSGVCSGKWNEARKARNAAALADPRVKAVREDAAVGYGSCSSIDECYDHEELLAALVEAGCETPRDAVKWARGVDGLHWESGLNQMSGEAETDNPIRAMYEESKERAKLPIDC